MRVERYAYDLNGNVLQFIDRRGHVSNYTYDGLNRHPRHAPDGSHTYDAADRVTQVVAPTGTITVGWDGLDRLTSEIGPQGR